MAVESEWRGAVFDGMPDGFAYLQVVPGAGGAPADILCVAVNRAFAGLFGLPQEGAAGKRLAVLLPLLGQEGGALATKCYSVIENGQSARFQVYCAQRQLALEVTLYRDKPGYLAAIFRAVGGEAEAAVGACGLATLSGAGVDGNPPRSLPVITGPAAGITACERVTALKKVEMELFSEKKHLEALFSNSPNAIVKIDRKHRVLDVNDSFVNLFGFSLAEIKGQNLDDVLDVGKQGAADRSLTAMLMQGKHVKTEAVRYNRDGRRIHMSIRAIPILVDGAVVGGYATYADITERKQAEEALRKSEERYKEILASIEEGYYEADLAGRVTFCNDAACKMLGYSRKELVGKSFRHLFKEPKVVLKAFNRVYNAARADRAFTVEIKRREGSTLFGELSISPIRNSAGAVTGFRGVARDISERIKVEEQLRYLSLHDQLTGLYNRAFFEEELKRLAGSRKYPITIISADLDGLKLINDTIGHACGDRQLIACAGVMKDSLRASDILARVGGDEFTAILPGTDERTSEKIAGRIRENLDLYNRTHAGPPLSLSLGVATALSKDTSLNELFKRADDLMYRDKLYRCDSVRSQIVQALLAALAERDYISEGHAQRLTDLCLKVGVRLNLSSRQLSDLALLAQVHDLGKVGIPDSILLKQAPLTGEEWEIMRRHPEKGYRIAISSPDIAGVADLILKHHERWDGKGYPLGLKRREIPVECRILAIVDAYDAMTNERPYSKARNKKAALAELRRCAGTQFDPDLVELFMLVL